MNPTFIDMVRSETNTLRREWIYSDEIFETKSSRFYRQLSKALVKAFQLAAVPTSQLQETFSSDPFKNL